MEIKATLEKPCTEESRIDFIITQNHNNGYEIRETENTLEAWGYTKEEKQEQERLGKDQMTLTPADVERALYKAKGMDFEDLKELIATGTGIDLKALAIEFRATNFYRGAMFGNSRLFDVVGTLLGYTPDDIDYLFENKELPN
ncbi:MAG: hypothetical protein MJ180_00545 [Candidatus Gastranaerophilales bacterium]|nr:hypothetical protein [Candidatus Gastranaerophilales bacterium]